MQGIKLIIGPTWSFTFNSLVPLASNDKIIIFNTSTLQEAINIEQGKGFAFHSGLSASDYAETFSQYLNKYPVKSLTIVYANNTWGEAQRNAFIKHTNKANISIKQEFSTQNNDFNDWSILVPKIKSVDSDLLLLLLNKGDLEIFLKVAKQQNLNAKIFASYHLYEAIAESKNKSIYQNTCFSYPLQQIRGNKEFFNKYQEVYHKEPRIYADSSYDTLFLIFEANKLAKLENIELNKALEKTQYQGISGLMQYSNSLSFTSGKCSLVCYADGELKIH